jgi:regulation of enolase protein 1 (concanavalin A-like superfamily)
MKRGLSWVALQVCAAVAIVCTGTSSAVAQTVPSPWTARDVGSPALSGSASHSSGTFTIDAAGADIWKTNDQFHFVYQQISGDVEIVARVDSLEMAHEWSKAGVMIRAALTGGSANAYALVSAGMGLTGQRRLSNGGGSTSTVGSSSARAPVWLRAVRTGNQVATSWSTNGSSWTPIATDTIALGTSAYVGIAVTSHNPSARATARVSNVRVTPLGMPSGQRSADIGSPAIAGSARYANGTYTITGAGRDIWDTADQFHFVYRQVSGDVDLVARVASIANTHSWAKAGVMVRESLAAESRHAVMVASVGRGYAFQRRPNPGVYSEHTAGGSGAPPGWVRLVRRGDLFEAYRSANGTSWTRIGTDTIPMSDTVYVGLAVTSHNTAAATTAVVDNFRVTASTTPANQDPSVALTSPSNSATFAAPASITLSASASDPENQLARVEFYSGSTRLGTDTSAPYSFAWSNVAAGTYTLRAVAFDAAGNSATSSSVTVTVGSAPVGPPRLVVFTASTSHSTVTSYELRIFAAGANPATATPIARSNLGKPAPASNGDITVDRATFFGGLATGSYQAAVAAISSSGQTQSTATPFTR